MKKLLLFVIVGFLIFLGCQKKDKSKLLVTSENVTKIEVIDFYGTHRCMTCKAIEANAKFTVETYFNEEVKEGKVDFKTINVDDDENYNIAERFEATGTALFINVIKDGKEKHIDLTNFAFDKGLDKEVFTLELKDMITQELAVL